MGWAIASVRASDIEDLHTQDPRTVSLWGVDVFSIDNVPKPAVMMDDSPLHSVMYGFAKPCFNSNCQHNGNQGNQAAFHLDRMVQSTVLASGTCRAAHAPCPKS